MGSLCLAQFSLDKQWYRGYVERVNTKEPMYDVFFIDFGNRCVWGGGRGEAGSRRFGGRGGGIPLGTNC